MAADYHDFNIRVNAISPGWFADENSTEKVVNFSKKVLEANVTGKNYALQEPVV
jgi:NAD(P)-dependent dehydrogenase (short-subunit alcohol dehydrogenase family)